MYAFEHLQEEVKEETDKANGFWDQLSSTEIVRQTNASKQMDLLQQLADCRETEAQLNLKTDNILTGQKLHDQKLQALQDDTESLVTTLGSAKRQKTRHTLQAS